MANTAGKVTLELSPNASAPAARLRTLAFDRQPTMFALICETPPLPPGQLAGSSQAV